METTDDDQHQQSRQLLARVDGPGGPLLEAHITAAIAGEDAAVELVGELDINSAKTLWGSLTSLVDSHRRLSVDLSGIRFIDASGLRMCLRLRTRGHDSGTVVHYQNPSDRVRYLLDIVDISLDGHQPRDSQHSQS